MPQWVKVAGFIIIGLFIYLGVDSYFEYRYWKQMKEESIEFVKNTISDSQLKSSDELAKGLSDLKLYFSDAAVRFNSENVKKYTKMYILSKAMGEKADYYDYDKKFYGLAASCHFRYLIHLYKKEIGQTQFDAPALDSFCQGWNDLERPFGVWDAPHSRGELKH